MASCTTVSMPTIFTRMEPVTFLWPTNGYCYSEFDMTKYYLLLIILFASVSSHAELSFDDPVLYDNLRTRVFEPYFIALQQGDLGAIGQFLPLDRYAEFKTLLEQNTTYSAYLKNHYDGSQFRLLEIVQVNQLYEAQVEIVWGDGRVSTLPVPVDIVKAQNLLGN